ncbi:LysR family transcriptional regulator [Paenibacillus thalictri]|uniref:LysR family transcriptional regulator n=1 Tax=Paenibacillus thalictri TaxID=2527873 RepID=A0A4Q9DMY9_9BACL|nr:LysR family transcriptional regulator [Paenibacillus thalictri]TBL77290.1 LysR family transcriptional regulator [Paenibacillus thalictri]
MKTLDKLETFLVLADCSSFIETAKRLYCSQPTITNHIHQLEEQFQTKLFHRSGKTVKLTKQGETFLSYAKQIVHLLEEASVKMKEEDRQDVLALYVSNYIAEVFFPEILDHFQHEIPKQHMEIHTYCYQDLKDSLLDGRTNMALMPIYPEDKYIQTQFESAVLFEDEFQFIVPIDHPLAGRKTIYSRDLRNETILLPRSDYLQQFIMTELGRHQSKVRYLQMSNFDMIKQAVKSHLGLAFLPHLAVAGENVRGELAVRSVSGIHMRRQNGFVFRKNVRLSPVEQSFFNVVERYFAAKVKVDSIEA